MTDEDRVRRHRSEERQVRQRGGETGNRISAPEAPAPESYVIEAPSRGNRVADFRSNANVRTGLSDPRLATWLYTVLVITAVMFSKKWSEISAVIVAETRK